MARGSKPGEPGKILSKLTPWERREYLSSIQTRYENGESIRAIAETEGVTFGNVRYWLTKVVGIKLRKRTQHFAEYGFGLAYNGPNKSERSSKA